MAEEKINQSEFNDEQMDDVNGGVLRDRALVERLSRHDYYKK